MAGWWETVERQAMTDSDREGFVNPQRLVWELSARLPANAIVAADSGSAANWYARHLKLGGDQRGSLSGTLATMGPGVPYVIGAKFAHPDRPAIALVGDGAMQMNGMAELITIKRYWQEWSDPRLIVAVLHNNDLNQVTWEMRAMVGVPKFAASQELPDISYAGFAASLGLGAIEVHAADEIGPAWERALAADRPTVLDVYTDPDVPAHPPARHPRADARHGQSADGRGRERLGGPEDRDSPKGPGVPSWHQGQLRWPSVRSPATPRPRAKAGRALTDIRTGRFERSLAGLAAAGALVTAAEIFTEHDGASFGNKMMWWPVVIIPTMAPAGVAAVFSRRAAKTVLPSGLRGGGGQRDAGHLPALARHHAKTRGTEQPPLQHRDGSAHVCAPAGGDGGGHGDSGLAVAPGRRAVSERVSGRNARRHGPGHPWQQGPVR